jgi:hypothetical protein
MSVTSHAALHANETGNIAPVTNAAIEKTKEPTTHGQESTAGLVEGLIDRTSMAQPLAGRTAPR